MRPKKKILIVGASEDRNGILRFLLDTYGYAVTVATTAAQALELLPADILLIDAPYEGIAYLLSEVRMLDLELAPRSIVLLARSAALPDGAYADAVIQAKDYCPAYLIERIKVLAARKRGPHPHAKPPVSVPVMTAEVMRGLA